MFRSVSFHKRLLIGILVYITLISAFSLTRFPHPNGFGDEAEYAALGRSWKSEKVFNSPISHPDHPSFDAPDAWHSRINIALFNLIDTQKREVFLNARLTSYLQGLFILLIVLVTVFLFPSTASALLFLILILGHERVFWSWHAFRPEITLTLFNTLAVIHYIALSSSSVFSHAKKIGWASALGLLNFFIVASHGNGITTVLFSSLFILMTGDLKFILAYGVTSLFSLIAFYFFQIAPTGLAESKAQIDAFFAYGSPNSSLLEAIQRDLTLRWKDELWLNGKSIFAKGARMLSYFSLIFVPLFFFRAQKNRFQKLFTLAPLFFVLLYVLIVGDKANIHLAEIIPFFALAALFLPKRTIWVPIILNLFLISYHTYSHRNESRVLRPDLKEAVSHFQPDLILGQTVLWFQFTEKFCCSRFLSIRENSFCSFNQKKIAWVKWLPPGEPNQNQNPEIAKRLAHCLEVAPANRTSREDLQLFDCRTMK